MPWLAYYLLRPWSLPGGPGGPGGPIGPGSPGIRSNLCLFVPCASPTSQRRPTKIFQYLKEKNRNKLIQEELRMSSNVVKRKESD